MRALVLAWVVLLAGCVTTPSEPPAPVGNAPTAPTGGDAASNGSAAPPPTMGERMPTTMERFVMLANQTLGVLRPEDGEMPLATVPQPLRATALYESLATPIEVPAWPSFPMRSAFETTGDVAITLSFSASAPAVSVNPRQAGFPPVGLWFGTTERHAFFLLVNEAPDSLEANKDYTVRATATPPQGGFFVEEGEQLSIVPFASYQTADGSPISFVVGGPDPAGFVLPHEHFELDAPRAIVLLEETGELAPNPAPSGDMHQQPVELAFTVPPEALYVVLEVSGAAKAGERVDVDGSIRTAAGDVIAGGSSPYDHERAAIGPGNLRAYGRDLLAHVTASATASGATFALKVTAYAP